MLWTAFILGLGGSLHCIGMCGPIAAIVPGGIGTNPTDKLIKALSYNLGRITTYAMLGLLLGYFGKNLHLFGWQQSISITVGVLLIIGVLFPLVLKKVKPNALLFGQVNRLKAYIIPQLNEKSATASIIIGMLNGLLPCGLVYIALAGAIVVGQPIASAKYMVLFGLGTIPALLAISLGSNIISLSFRKQILKIVPVMVLAMGLLFIVRGMNLGIPYVSPKLTNTEKISCH